MGIDIYLRDRPKQTIFIEALPKKVGMLRRLSKVTELNDARVAQIESVKEAFRGKPTSPAAMIPGPYDGYLAADPSRRMDAYLVIGWDAERIKVTDAGWDDLPTLGYAVLSAGSDELLLHEMRDGLLYPLSVSRAIELGILSKTGKLKRPVLV